MADKPTNREQLKELNEKIEAGIWNVFNSGKFAEYLQVMSRFHTYSVKNQMLIHSQCPNAVKVASFTPLPTILLTCPEKNCPCSRKNFGEKDGLKSVPLYAAFCI